MAKEFKEKKVYTKRNHEEEDYMNDDMDEGKGR